MLDGLDDGLAGSGVVDSRGGAHEPNLSAELAVEEGGEVGDDLHHNGIEQAAHSLDLLHTEVEILHDG